jgi:LacI family transcriptional regulator
MRDVARAATVSLKTVSRVVNDEGGVRPETAARVHEAIALLGFRRNDLARMLRQGRPSRTLGLVIEDVANPFYSTMTRAVEEVVRSEGYLVIAGSSDEDPECEQDLIRTLCERRVEGLLIVPAGVDHRFLLPDLHMGMAVVFMDRPPGMIEADTILIDNVGGAREATRHLLDQGHRRIGMVGDLPDIFTAAERREGYAEAMKAAGIGVDELLVKLGPHDVAAAETATRELLALPDPPTAIFAANNRNTIGALRAIHGTGGRTALVGFDDFELADLLSTPVTVVAHSPADMGRQAAELLCRRLAGDKAPPRRVRLPVQLVRRGSGEVAPP